MSLLTIFTACLIQSCLIIQCGAELQLLQDAIPEFINHEMRFRDCSIQFVFGTHYAHNLPIIGDLDWLNWPVSLQEWSQESHMHINKRQCFFVFVLLKEKEKLGGYFSKVIKCSILYIPTFRGLNFEVI